MNFRSALLNKLWHTQGLVVNDIVLLALDEMLMRLEHIEHQLLAVECELKEAKVETTQA